MFESRKIPLSGQSELVWDEGGRFLLSCVLDENKQCDIEIKAEDTTAAIIIHAMTKQKEPYFGRQEYFDGRKGLTYSLILPKITKSMVVYQHKEWWLRPFFPKTLDSIPEKTQLLLVMQEERYFAILAVCARDSRSDMEGDKNGINITIASNKQNSNRIEDLSLVIAGGNNPYKCITSAVKKALQILGKESYHKSKRIYPKMFDYFGWCSWDAFYHQVSEKGIMEKMQEIDEKQIPVKWVLIDDGWLEADYKKQVLLGLDAYKEHFPNGLRNCVDSIKQTNNVKWVGVWHAVMGYWNGLQTQTPAYECLKEATIVIGDGRIMPMPKSEKAFEFYDIWHTYLKESCGVDFVKVDGQSSISAAYEGMESYGKASAAIQKGLNASVALHFQNRIINCMGMASEDMWNRPSSGISRSSDDFVPQVSHGFGEHALQNSYNSLLQGEFYFGDWDMFFSAHEEAWQNSILRAVSGGPIYISDPLGKTESETIRPLIFEDGKIIRCEESGLPTVDCLFQDATKEEYPLKVFNQYKETFVIAAFAVNQKNDYCQGILSTTDIPQMEHKEWLIYAWREKRLYRMDDTAPHKFLLHKNEAELFFIVPKRGKHQIIGILEKYISIAGIQKILESENKTYLTMKEAGTLGIYSEEVPEKICCDVNDITKKCVPEGKNFYTLQCQKNSILEITWKQV